MKAAYNAPKLTEHGNVEEITQAFGNSSQRDTIFAGGANVPNQPLANGTGSRDGIVVPM